MEIQNIHYQPYYCEENIWQLCHSPELEEFSKKVVFISNKRKSCEFFYQKIAASDDSPIYWDYHVILLAKMGDWCVFDLDTKLPFPVLLNEYLDKSFSGLNTSFYQPNFKIIDAQWFMRSFYSDRKHMLDANGQWLAEPPTWPLIQGFDSTHDKLYLNDLMDFSALHNVSHTSPEPISLADFRSLFNLMSR